MVKYIIKTAMASLGKFIVCNLVAFVPGFIVAFVFFVFIQYNPATEKTDLFNILIYACVVAAFVFSFYFVYFRGNKKYKKLYLDESYEGRSIKSIIGMHIRKFTKYELPIIFVISVLLSFVPSVILGKCGISFLFMSAGFFVDITGTYLLGGDTFIVRLIGYILWDIYIVICYFGCLRVAFWHWNKTRLKQPKG